MELLGEQPNLIIDGSEISIFLDLGAITLRKRRSFLPLLHQLAISYHRGFPVKLMVTFGSRKITLRTLQEAKDFYARLRAPF